MSRFGSTITDSDAKILSSLFNPYEWYRPSTKINPQFEQQSPFGRQAQGLESQFQQQKPFEQQGVQQQIQQPLQQKEISQQQFQQQQGLQQQPGMQPIEQGFQQQYQQPLQRQQFLPQQQLQQDQLQQGMQQQQFQQPIEQRFQQYQQPLQQQQFFPQQQLQQDQLQQGMQQQFQQPLQQQGIQQFQQPAQQLGMDQQMLQTFQKETPSDAAFQQGLSTFIGQGPQQLGFFPEMPSTVFFEIRDIDRVGGKEKKFYEEKQKGKRIPIIDISETSRGVSLMQGNWNEWQKEAQKCIDKILKLNHKAYNQFQHLQNFKLMESGINYQNDVDNWMNRLKKNLDNLVKENERLRAELPSGSWGSKGFQGVRGGVDLQVADAIDSSHVIKPSDIKKLHVTTEKIGQWHPQQEKHTFTEKVKDTAIGIATTVENAALHPIESVGKIASTMEQAALHPIQTVEKAADAVVHTVM